MALVMNQVGARSKTYRARRGQRLWHIVSSQTATMCGTSVSGPTAEILPPDDRCGKCVDKARARTAAALPLILILNEQRPI